MCKVSFVVPVFNVPEHYLKQCVKSILAQTYESFELLIVDDGSTSQVANLCDSFKTLDSRIRVIHQDNAGLSAARNTGVRNAQGEYVSFVDGDDWVDENIISNLLPRNSVDIIFGKIVKDFGNRRKKSPYPWITDTLFEAEDSVMLQSKILDFKANISTVCGKLFNINFLKKNNIFHDEKLKHGSEGIEFNYRAFSMISVAKFVNQDVYYYVADPHSITTSPSYSNALLALAGFEKINNDIRSLSKSDALFLQSFLQNRIAYLIVTTMISSLFHPKARYSHHKAAMLADDFIKKPLIKQCLIQADWQSMDLIRRIVLYATKHRIYFLLRVIGMARYAQIHFRS